MSTEGTPGLSALGQVSAELVLHDPDGPVDVERDRHVREGAGGGLQRVEHFDGLVAAEGDGLGELVSVHAVKVTLTNV